MCVRERYIQLHYRYTERSLSITRAVVLWMILVARKERLLNRKTRCSRVDAQLFPAWIHPKDTYRKCADVGEPGARGEPTFVPRFQKKLETLATSPHSLTPHLITFHIYSAQPCRLHHHLQPVPAPPNFLQLRKTKKRIFGASAQTQRESATTAAA